MQPAPAFALVLALALTAAAPEVPAQGNRGVTPPGIAANQREQSQDADLRIRLVPITQGNVESSFGGDPTRFQQTACYRAARHAGVDIESPDHPLIVHSHRDQRLYYLFYNAVDHSPADPPWLIQRVKKTIRNYRTPDDTEPETQITYLVEVLKTRLGSSIRPDQHFGSFGLHGSYKREIIKEIETGVGEIPGVATGRPWPFRKDTLFRQLQDYAGERGLYDRVKYASSQTWTLSVSLDREGNYSIEVPELGIDAPHRLPDPRSAQPNVDPASHDVILTEGQGTGDLHIGRSRAEDIARVLGAPVGIDRVSTGASNHHHRKGLTFNVYAQGVINTIMTRPAFGGRTARGIRHGDTRDRVIKVYGAPARDATTGYAAYPGVIFYFDADQHVNRIVIR